MSTINIVIADPGEAFTDNIRAGLRRRRDINIIGCCRSGAELIKLVRSQRPDAVILNTILEDIDGITVLKRLGSDRAGTAFIVCTEIASDSAICRAAKYGADTFICKPVDIDALYDTVTEIVAFSKTQEAQCLSDSDGIDSAIYENLLENGISTGCEGFRLMRHAVRYILCEAPDKISMTKQLYPELARAFGSTAERVERNIRSAIGRAYSRGMLCEFAKRPSNKEFMMALAADAMKIHL